MLMGGIGLSPSEASPADVVRALNSAGRRICDRADCTLSLPDRPRLEAYCSALKKCTRAAIVSADSSGGIIPAMELKGCRKMT